MNFVCQDVLTVLAATFVPNVLAGNRFERCPYGIGLGKFLATASAVGLTVELNIGGRSITPVVALSIVDRIPVEPDDTIAKDVQATQGELIQISVNNPTAGPLDFYYRFEMDEMEYQAA